MVKAMSDKPWYDKSCGDPWERMHLLLCPQYEPNLEKNLQELFKAFDAKCEELEALKQINQENLCQLARSQDDLMEAQATLVLLQREDLLEHG